MALRFPLTVAQKQQILYVSPLPPQDLVQWGDRYLEAALFHEALDFYGTAGDSQSIRSLVGKAVELGDSLLLINACKALGEPPSPELAHALKERCRELGKAADEKRADVLLASPS